MNRCETRKVKQTNHYDTKAYLNVHLNWIRKPEKAKSVTKQDIVILSYQLWCKGLSLDLSTYLLKNLTFASSPVIIERITSTLVVSL
ncbi:uncharacterized protein OCT59_009678 [Rhizophagus irregularis]|uniref:uncharacterized protein n=1 Tax=Rhizophagus irregularis TaxID=588596 RepID=UPI0019F56737|nr:hypothetical protein OCT59_009678 [Rhizophagus irregularis]GET53717.1 hypothetical protein RIR_jg13049.t1 [Rhizophagus irregularis DAOM 181602=DAOM 197198]